ARDKARATMCLSNMKQCGLALMQYSQDYDETLPSWPFRNDALFADPRFKTWSYSVWVDAAMPYVKNGGVFGCPNGPEFLRGPAGAKINVNLAYNEYIENQDHGWSRI